MTSCGGSAMWGSKRRVGTRAADAYLFTVTNWARHVGLDLSDFPAIRAFQHRMLERPAVQAAMDAEGLAWRATATA